MSDTIIFYNNPMSRGRVVHWMLEELGAKYEMRILDWQKAEHKKPDYLKLNPMGKIPTIVHNGVVVTETNAICAYLADAFPKSNLAPAINDPKRGTYYRWFFFVNNCLEPAVMDKYCPRVNQIPASHLGYGTYDDTIKALEGAVMDGYLLGSQFSAADLYLSAVLGWYFMQKMMEPTSILTKYVERCSDRAALRRVNEFKA